MAQQRRKTRLPLKRLFVQQLFGCVPDAVAIYKNAFVDKVFEGRAGKKVLSPLFQKDAEIQHENHTIASHSYADLADIFSVALSKADEETLGACAQMDDAEAVKAKMRRIIGKHLTKRRRAINSSVDAQGVFRKGVTEEWHSRIPLTDLEDTALNVLCVALDGSKPLVAHIKSRVNGGTTGLLLRLHGCETCSHDAVLHLRPVIGGASFQDCLADLLAEFGLARDLATRGSFSPLLDALVSENALLIIHNIHVFYSPGRGKCRNALERLVQSRPERDPEDRTHILLTQVRYTEPVSEVFERHGVEQVELAPEASPGAEARDLFDDLLSHYGSLMYAPQRRLPHPQLIPPESPAMHRFSSNLHRLQQIGRKLPVATLRLRAAAMVNMANPNEADPTQGFVSLVPVNIAKIDPSFELMRQDIETALLLLDQAHGNALKVLSTGVYWVSRSMFEDLLEDGVIPRCDWSDVEQLRTKHGLAHQYFGDADRYSGSLAVLAVAQDMWRAQEPFSHSIVHRRIAEKLVAGANNLPTASHSDGTDGWGLLEREYPYKPPVEGPAVILRSEALRHFIRASETAEDPCTATQDAVAQYRMMEAAALDGTNGNALGLVMTERLSTEHQLSEGGGRYQLKKEILYLLSQDGRGQSPLGQVDTAFEQNFLKEVGMVNLALMWVDDAQDALHRHLKSSEQQKFTALNQWVDSALNLFQARIMQLDVPEASNLKADIMEVLLQHEHFAPMIEERKLYADEIRNKNLTQDERRLLERFVFLELSLARMVEGPGSVAVKSLEFLDYQSLWPLQGNRALNCIDNLLAASREAPELIDVAMILIEPNITLDHIAVMPHEAMRFAIRRARCLTLSGRPDVAQMILNEVVFALSRRGGAPRTLHDLQIAAGECLIALGRSDWAFDVYIYPCLRRAVSNNAGFFAAEAALLAQDAIASIQGMGRDLPPPPHKALMRWRQNDIARSDKMWEVLRRRGSTVKLEREKDPFHGFDLAVFPKLTLTVSKDLKNPKTAAAYTVLVKQCLPPFATQP